MHDRYSLTSPDTAADDDNDDDDSHSSDSDGNERCAVSIVSFRAALAP